MLIIVLYDLSIHQCVDHLSEEYPLMTHLDRGVDGHPNATQANLALQSHLDCRCIRRVGIIHLHT